MNKMTINIYIVGYVMIEGIRSKMCMTFICIAYLCQLKFQSNHNSQALQNY